MLSDLQNRQLTNAKLILVRNFKTKCETTLDNEKADHKLKNFLFNELSEAYEQGVKDSLAVVKEMIK